MKKRLTFALVVLAMLALAPVSSAREDVRHEFKEQVPADEILRVVIHVPPSEVHVRTGAGKSIIVSGTVDVPISRRGTRDEAQKVADAMSMNIDRHASRATISPLYLRAARSRRARHGAKYAFTVTVPRGTHVEVRQSTGSVDVQGDLGDVDVAMRSGDINVVVPRSSVQNLLATSRLGDVHADVGDRIISNEGILPRTIVWNNPNGTTSVHLKVYVGDIKVRLR